MCQVRLQVKYFCSARSKNPLRAMENIPRQFHGGRTCNVAENTRAHSAWLGAGVPAPFSVQSTWTAIDADSKLILSYLCGGRDAEWAYKFMEDLASRVTTRIQITTDGHR